MKDLLIDPKTGDIMIAAVRRNQVIEQDFVIGDADDQIAERLLVANRGDFKQYPLLGGEITKMLGGSVDPFWPGRIKEQLQACGIPASRVSINEQTIKIS